MTGLLGRRGPQRNNQEVHSECDKGERVACSEVLSITGRKLLPDGSLAVCDQTSGAWSGVCRRVRGGVSD